MQAAADCFNKLSRSMQEVAANNVNKSVEDISQAFSTLATAETAEAEASAAVTAANTAQTAAEEAETATTVEATVADVAQTAAETAETTATVAATVADTAQTAAQEANTATTVANTAAHIGLTEAEIADAAAALGVSEAYFVETTTAAAATDATAALAVAEATSGTAATGAAAGTSTLAAVLTGAAVAAKSFAVALATNPLTWIAATAGVAIGALYKLSKSYENAASSAEEAYSAYTKSQSELDSLNSELETTASRISELQALKDAGTITLAEEAELEKLQRQNEELERSIQLQEQLVQAQSKESADAAIKALSNQWAQSHYTGKNVSSEYTDIVSAAETDLKQLQAYQNQYDLASKLWDSATTQAAKDNYKEQMESAQKGIDEYKSYLADSVSEISGYIDALSNYDNLDSSGQELLDSAKSFVESYYDTINQGLSDTEKALSSINSFFDGSTGSSALSDKILKMVQDGDTATEAIGKLGLSLEDLGLSNSAESVNTLNKYFDELRNSATQAASAVDEIDSSLSGIATASESENAGDNFDDYISYIDNARRYYAQGKTGLDDFKTVASSLNNGSQDAADNLKQFSSNIEKISKYLTVDTDSKLTQSSSTSNVDGTIKSSITLNDGQLTVTKQNMLDLADAFEEARQSAESTGTEFESTADLAEALDIPIDFLEYALGKMEDYDISTAFDNLPKASQNLNEAKTELAALQAVYDDFGVDSDGEGIFGDRIAMWQQVLDEADGDLSKLNTDIVVQIKAAYDLAQIQAQIDELQSIANYSDNTTDWAKLLAEKDAYISTAESQIGIGQKGITIPVEYQASSDTINQLQEQLKTVTDSNQRLEILMEISNIQDAQKEVLDAFQKEHPEVSFEADPTEATRVFNEWIASSEAKEILAKVDADTSDALQKVANLLGISVDDLLVNVDANTQDAEDKINGLESEDHSVDMSLNLDDSGALKKLEEFLIGTRSQNDDGSWSITVDENNLNGAERKIKSFFDWLQNLFNDPVETEVDADTEDAEEKLGEVAEQSAELDGTTSVIELSAEDEASDTIEDTISAITGIPEDVVTELEAHDDLTETVIAASNYIEDIPDSVVTEMMAQDNATDALKVLADYIQKCNTTTTTTTTTSGTETAVANLSNVSSAKDGASGNANVSVTTTGVSEASAEMSTLKSEVDAISGAAPTVAPEAQTKTALSALNALKSFKIPNKSFTVSAVNKASTVLTSIKTALSSLVSKTITVTTKKVTVGEAAGTVHYNGTANNNHIDSNAFGNWGIAKDETSLVNELGEEVIVRDGKPFTVNNGYPAITKLKKGDIVFNHKQSEDLLEKGYVTGSHARIVGSFAHGTVPESAYASGTTSSSNTNTVDWYEILLDRAEAIIKKYSTKVENAFLHLSTRLSNLSSTISATKTELSKQQSAYNGYMAAANKVKLSASLKQKVRDGAYYIYDGYSDSEKELIDQYKDLIDKAESCQQAISELSESLGELYTQAFELVQSNYSKQFDTLSNYEQMLLNNIELTEAQGRSANSTDYESLIQYMQREVSKGQAEYSDLVTKLNNAVSSGYVQKWSDEWWDMYNATLEVATGIQEAEIALEEYQQEILDLQWNNFDYIQEQISDITKETEFLVGLLSEADLFDDDGKLTNSGIAALSLYNDQMQVYTKQAQDYANAINEVNSLLAEDPSNQNLIDRRNELLEAQRDAIESAQGEKDAIKDLIEDAYDAQIESLQDIVDAYEDSLDAMNDLNSYQKKVQESSQTIAALLKQIDTYQNDTSEETKAKVQQLQVDLKSAQEDLEETQTEQLISEQKKMLDNLVTEYEDALFAGLDDIDSLLSNILSSVEDPTEIKSTIQDAAREVGYTISDNLSEIIRFGNIENILNSINTSIMRLLNSSDYVVLGDTNDPIRDNNGNIQTASSTELYDRIRAILKNQNTAADTIHKQIFGFSNGGFVAELQKAALANGDDLLAINTLKVGEAVLTPEQTKALQNFAPKMPLLEDVLDKSSLMPVTSTNPAMRMGDMNITHEWNINIEHASDWEDITYQMQHDPQFPKFIRSMTVDLPMGGHPLAYTKYWNQ